VLQHTPYRYCSTRHIVSARSLSVGVEDSLLREQDLSGLSTGILDIFGFENFKQNGFDQMCINLANEQLHLFFNEHIFAAEIGSYAEEGIALGAEVMFADNKQIIDMFFRLVATCTGPYPPSQDTAHCVREQCTAGRWLWLVEGRDAGGCVRFVSCVNSVQLAPVCYCADV
jgi:hypothetical protein